jgi:AcrR family transcriptional regulator
MVNDTPPPPFKGQLYIHAMSETYQSKRERRQRMLEALPAGLRPHIAQRNIEAVSSLSPQAQERLLEAVQAGLKRLPRAIEQLRADPQISVADLLDPPAQPETELPAQNDSASIGQEVADLIQECFPDMPRVPAQALAEADVMQVVRSVAETHRQVFKSGHIKTDFVMLTLYGLVRQTLERLEEIIEETPALRQAYEQTNEWRKEETC